MEGADVEFPAQRALRERAQAADLQPAQSVGQTLRRPNRIAIDADFRPQQRHVGVLPDVVD